MAERKLKKTHFSEVEAANELGISVERFRELIRDHILDRGEDLRNSRRAIFHPSDLLVLRLLSSGASVPTAPG